MANEQSKVVGGEEHSDLMLAVQLLSLAKGAYYLSGMYEVRDKECPEQLDAIIGNLKSLAAKELTSDEREKLAKVLGGEDVGLMQKAKMQVKAQNKLPDSAFAYIMPGGKKDDSGKTVPRSNRKLPIHDKAHVRNALARFNQTTFHSTAAKHTAARKILRAAKKFDIEVSDDSAVARAAKKSSKVAKRVEDLRKAVKQLAKFYK